MSVNSWNVPGSLAVANSLTVGGNPVQGQIQSDYGQTDNTKLDFVKNKPPVTFDGTTTSIAGAVSIPGQIVAATQNGNYSQIVIRNTNTSTTDATQVAEISLDRTAAVGSAKASFGCNPVRGAYWWVNGSDRISVDPSTGNVTIGNSLVCPNALVAKDLTVNNSFTSNATVVATPPPGGGNYSCVLYGTGANAFAQLGPAANSSNYLQAGYVSAANNFLIGSSVGDAILKTGAGNLLLGNNNTIGARIDSAANFYIPNKAYVQTQLNVSSGSGSQQATVANSSTSADSSQVAEIYVDRTAAGSQYRAAHGVSTRGAYWWVNGADRIVIDPSTGVIKMPNGMNIAGPAIFSNLTSSQPVIQSAIGFQRYQMTSQSNSASNAIIPLPNNLWSFTPPSSGYSGAGYTFTQAVRSSDPGINNGTAISFYVSGVYSINFGGVFSAAATQNQMWLTPMYYLEVGETGNASTGQRLGFSNAYNGTICSGSYTGMIGSGTTLALNAYTNGTNVSITSSPLSYINITLLTRQA